MATPSTSVTVDNPHAGHDHGGDGHGDIHGGEPHMMLGHDGKMHASNLQHFFVSSEQQFEASKLGMWLFLATEILLFGGMFVAYGIFRILYPEVYEAASLQLDTVLGATNTLVLLLSSLTMAWAIRGAQMDNRKVLIGNLVATMVLASGFLVVKYFEYSHKFHEGIYPGVNFQLAEGTQSVSEITGATALTPIFQVAPHGEDHGEESAVASPNRSSTDIEVVDSDSAPIAVEEAPLVGEDQNVQPVDPTTAGDLADETAISESGQATVADAVGPGAALDDAMANEAARAGDAGLGGATAGGLETEHGLSHEEGDPKELIFKERRAGIFFSIYYVMTGIHALHIVIGIIAIGFLTFFAVKDRYSSVWYTPVENVGLYWHIVDIIWIFVFPLMYLI